MFNLFSKNRKPECPISQDMRLWLENSFLWLATQFGHETIRDKSTIIPNQQFFPIRYDGSETSLSKTAEIVARQMEINIADINLKTFKENIQEFHANLGYHLFTEIDKDSKEQMAAGLYFDKNEGGKYDIFIEEANLHNPENLVAVLAHEFSHIKILGEKRLEQNDECLTDLTTVVFGFGIFNANSSFREVKTINMWGHNTLGYLTQQEWGYALALYSHFRAEENPDWIKYLSSNIESDFKKSQAYIMANTDKIFWEDYNSQGGG